MPEDELPPTNRKVNEAEFAKLVGWSVGAIGKMRRDGLIEYGRDGHFGVYYLIPDHLTSFNERVQKRGHYKQDRNG